MERRTLARWTRSLAESELLRPLGDEAHLGLARQARLRRLRRGELLWGTGERPDALAVVLSGRLDVERATESGQRILLRSLGTGEVVGLCIIAGEAHSADLRAGGPVEVLTISGSVFRELLRERPELALRCIARLGGLVRNLTDELEELRSLDIRERVQRLLTRLADGRREIHYTHEELAAQVGATRENVSRALKALERDGSVICRRGRVEIVDLREIALRREARQRPGQGGEREQLRPE
jgi:CRP/FNR family transcriptional regulator